MEQQRNIDFQRRISTEESERLHQKTLQELNLKHAKEYQESLRIEESLARTEQIKNILREQGEKNK